MFVHSKVHRVEQSLRAELHCFYSYPSHRNSHFFKPEGDKYIYKPHLCISEDQDLEVYTAEDSICFWYERRVMGLFFPKNMLTLISIRSSRLGRWSETGNQNIYMQWRILDLGNVRFQQSIENHHQNIIMALLHTV